MSASTTKMIKNMVKAGLPLNISTDYRHMNTCGARGGIVYTVSIPGNHEICIYQSVTVENESTEVIEASLRELVATLPELGATKNTIWPDAKAAVAIDNVIEHLQRLPGYRHLVEHLKKGVGKGQRALIEAWLRTASKTRATLYMDELLQTDGAAGKLSGPEIKAKYMVLEGESLHNHHRLLELQLLHRANQAADHGRGPPLGIISSKAEQQNAADKAIGVRSKAVGSALLDGAVHQDSRLLSFFEKAEHHGTDRAHALPALAVLMERHVSAARNMECVVDNGSRVSFKNTATRDQHTHTVGLDVLKAILAADTMEDEIAAGQVCTTNSFATVGYHDGYTLAAAARAGIEMVPPVWFRWSTMLQSVFDGQRPAVTMVATGTLEPKPSECATPTLLQMGSTASAGRPKNRRRFSSAGETPGAGCSRAASSRETKCKSCGIAGSVKRYRVVKWCIRLALVHWLCVLVLVLLYPACQPATLLWCITNSICCPCD